MASRREFLQAGVAASMLPIAGLAGTSSAPAVETLPLYKIIFDHRFPSSREFAAQARTLGLAAHGIEGDITDVWYHDLSLRWIQEPVAIGGLTAHGPLFCLERLAWDHRMRVVFRGQHTVSANGRMEHALTGPQTLLGDASLLAGRPGWASSVADLMARFPVSRADTCDRTIVTPTRAAGLDSEPLFSWVIAPKKEDL
ncbi:MAG TPA: hypothetical protein VLY24_25730 [Bryobacteraceae bacterium]|nr:hypothetical protein [Bryobacteraceae bacterium]